MVDVSTVQGLLDQAEQEWRKVHKLRRYLKGDFPVPYKPDEAGGEYDRLADRAVTNMLQLVVDMQSQMLFVEGYESPSQGKVAWGEWQKYRFDSRQIGVHREALAYGKSYVAMAPNHAGVWRPVAFPAARMYAEYLSAEADPWPEYAIAADQWGKDDTRTLWVFTPGTVEQWLQHRDSVERVGAVAHGFDHVPVVQFANRVDLDGEAVGQIEPLIGLNERLNQSVFDLMMTSTFSSFKIKTLTGVLLGDGDDDDDDEPDADKLEKLNDAMQRQKLRMAQNRVLVASDPEAKFGQLDETPLAGFIQAVELAVRQIATVAQVPPHALLGSMSNLSAESLAAAESGLQRKVKETQHSFGESWEQLLRLMAFQAGDMVEAGEMNGQVMWADMSARSLSQAVDAWGKAAQMLHIPFEVLWRKIPGMTESDIAKAKSLLKASPQEAFVQQLFGKDADSEMVTPEVDGQFTPAEEE